jgi:flagellar hook-associated protein 1 FlgK
MANLLSIGKSGLLAAQVGLSTTGHNIANANVPGYSRQAVVQQAGQAQNLGNGFVGSGTEVVQVKRYYDNFLASQVRSAQSTSSSLEAYSAQISQVDNMLADPTAGLSPALQDFFSGVQDLAANPSLAASRQALVSSGESLAARFSSLSARLTDIGNGVNAQIETDVGAINAYSKQIAKLNEVIGSLGADGNNQPNDLLDQRDLLVSELSKFVKTTVVSGSNNSLTVSIGSGQPLVVGKQSFDLNMTASPADQVKGAISYASSGNVTVLPDSTFTGGEVGGLLDFRSGVLDRTENSLGRVAISLASAFNAQHKLGVDLSGTPGQDFFTVAKAEVTAGGDNVGNPIVEAVVTDTAQLKESDYSMRYDGTASQFVVTRLSDGHQSPIAIADFPKTIDGVEFRFTPGTMATTAGDSYTIKPTLNGASGFGVTQAILADRSTIAAAAPLIASAIPASNVGTGKISELGVDGAYVDATKPRVTIPLTLTYVKADLSLPGSPSSLQGFPDNQDVTITSSSGVVTPYAATGSARNIPYNAGDKINVGGINLALSGTLVNGDTFTIEKNVGAVGDSRNAALLAALQSKNVIGGTETLQDSYAATVSFVGNKTREVQINAAASAALLTQATKSQQSVSGVNLDEEAANLLQYQQAYQAAGKAMQIASTLFDVLLTLGR